MIHRFAAALAVAAALAAAAALSPASAQTSAPPSGVPTVDIRPAGASASDPAGGDWFVTKAAPGQTVRLQARLFNPADIAQTVRLSTADLIYGEDASPRVPDPPYRGVGTWAAFDQPTIVVPPHENVVTGFTVTPPNGAPPGDHVGVVVVEHAAEGNSTIAIVKKVSVKLYVTVPGDAPRQFSIHGVSTKKDSSVYAKELAVEVTLRNDGRIRLQPVVSVNGVTASGPGLLMTQAYERYTANVKVPFWGGPVRLKIAATTTSDGFAGPARQLYATAFVVPWHLLAIAIGFLLAALGVRIAWRRRGSRYTDLQSDLRRIERMLSAAPAPAAQPADADPDLAIRAAMKQARRAGDAQTEARLRERLETDELEITTGLATVLERLRTAPPERIEDLIGQARAYGVSALREHKAAVGALPPNVRMRLLFGGSHKAPARRDPHRPARSTKG